LVVALFAEGQGGGAEVAVDFGKWFFRAVQEHGLELFEAQFVFLGVENLGEAVGDDGQQISGGEGELGDGEGLILEEAEGDVGVGVFQDRFCLGLIVQDGKVAGQGKVELLGIGTADVSESKIVRGGGERQHDVVDVGEQFLGLVEAGELHGGGAFDHGH